MTAPPFEALLFMIGSVLLALATHLLIWRRLILPAGLSPGLKKHSARLFRLAGALFPIGMFQLLLMRHESRALASPLMTVVFVWVGIVIFLVWAVLIMEVLTLAFRPASAMRRTLAWLCLASACTAAILALVQAAERPRLIRTELAVDEDLAGYRIVQLSDLHIGPTLGRSFASDVVNQVQPLAPDLIVISGDIVDGSVATMAPEVGPLASLRARDGVVAVLGNHEYLSGADEWVQEMKSFGWHVLRDGRLSLPRLDVVGLDEFAPGGTQADTLLANSGRRTLVVSHTPHAFAAACRAGVDIALAGHTHGGQVFPFGLLEWIQQGYLAGAYQCGRTQLYVSSGTGYWGPPMRLGSRNEISLLELVRR